MDEFLRLGLSEPLARALASFGFEGPTPVQEATIPLVLERRDAFVQSETGTGKTFAYLAPAMQVSASAGRKKASDPAIIVATPTQELAVQIGREADRLASAAGLDLRVAVVLGGTSLDKQVAKLRDRPDIVVGTLGRLSDLIALGRLRTGGLGHLVLDEADRLMAPETSALALALIKAAPRKCSRVFVSATLPERFRREIRPLLDDPSEISVRGDPVLAGNIEHWCFYCDSRKRLDFVRRMEAALHPERCLVFISQAARVPGSAERLAAYGLPVGSIHASMEKEARRVALERFAKGEIRYLVTSDLGARGLDIAAVSHIVSLDLPEEYTIYTHRAGRTGRAGAKGVSVVLADGVELARASKIAVRGGFVFRCKVLESGLLLEPSTDDFFAAAAAAEEERIAAKASRIEAVARRPNRDRPMREASFQRGQDRPRPMHQSDDRSTEERKSGRAPRVYRVDDSEEGKGRAYRARSEERKAQSETTSSEIRPSQRHESDGARNAPRGRPLQDRAPQGHGPRDRAPQGRPSQERAPRDRAPQGHGPHDRAPQGHGPRDRAPQGRPSQERAPRDRAPQGHGPRDRAPQGRSPQGRPPRRGPADGRPPRP